MAPIGFGMMWLIAAASIVKVNEEAAAQEKAQQKAHMMVRDHHQVDTHGDVTTWTLDLISGHGKTSSTTGTTIVVRISTNVEVPISTDIEVPISTDIEVPISTDIEVPISSDIEVPISSDAEVPTSNYVTVPTSTDVGVPTCTDVDASTFTDVDVYSTEMGSLTQDFLCLPTAVEIVTSDIFSIPSGDLLTTLFGLTTTKTATPTSKPMTMDDMEGDSVIFLANAVTMEVPASEPYGNATTTSQFTDPIAKIEPTTVPGSKGNVTFYEELSAIEGEEDPDTTDINFGEEDQKFDEPKYQKLKHHSTFMPSELHSSIAFRVQVTNVLL